ncbi:MAG: ABC transporter permease [Bullifex sp.]
MIFENIKIALTSMVHNKLRTLLSLLGIIIGVAAVVAILNLGQSATASITTSMNIGGIDLVTVYPAGNSRNTNVFDTQFGEDLMVNVSGIETVLPTYSSSTRIRSGQEIKSVSIQGITSNYFSVMNAELLYGDYFSALDNINRRQVVVIGKTLADDLFPAGNAVGSYISVFRGQSKRYQIVGVLDEKDAMLGASFNETVFMPINTFDQRFMNMTHVSSYVCKVNEGQNATEVSKRIESYLDKLVGSDYYSTFSAASLVEMADQVTGTFTSFLAAIAAISLVVGGIGIMNIMLVSVAERTREIGIRKALGASPKVIRGQFLVEAITLTVLGGLIGIGLGIFLSYAIINVVGWDLYFSYSAIAISLGFSMFVGIFFGWYPAAKASKLDPIEALSYE